ncbi:MAG: hypothetical protein ACD_28C00129G0003 [uncultured bacterium]|nr:MAG: hypothetical protein ACD_28C00129G0003 [uncultured bacterium]KKT76151.1 MAG: hypothetical protein UW70_C0021G0018 [Candidatus Peregrinibacteria bacterium GW2011_GWA2_44_7]
MSADSAFKKSDDEDTLEIEVTLEGEESALSPEEAGVEQGAATGEEKTEVNELPVSLILEEFSKPFEYFIASVGDDITEAEGYALIDCITLGVQPLIKPNAQKDLELGSFNEGGVFNVLSKLPPKKKVLSKILNLLEEFRLKEMGKKPSPRNPRREIFIYTQG